MKKLLPIILILIGIGAGVGAGVLLKPKAVEVVEINPCGEQQQSEKEDHSGNENDGKDEATEFVKLNNQFIVPIVTDGRVASLIVMSLNIEVDVGQKEAVYSREPKLRDALLQVLFDHANMGGFTGAYTNSNNMDILRIALSEVAQKTIGNGVKSVLILDIARQDN